MKIVFHSQSLSLVLRYLCILNAMQQQYAFHWGWVFFFLTSFFLCWLVCLFCILAEFYSIFVVGELNTWQEKNLWSTDAVWLFRVWLLVIFGLFVWSFPTRNVFVGSWISLYPADLWAWLALDVVAGDGACEVEAEFFLSVSLTEYQTKWLWIFHHCNKTSSPFPSPLHLCLFCFWSVMCLCSLTLVIFALDHQLNFFFSSCKHDFMAFPFLSSHSPTPPLPALFWFCCLSWIWYQAYNGLNWYLQNVLRFKHRDWQYFFA